MHLDAIKADCDALAIDVEKSLRLKDAVENEKKNIVYATRN